jgi:hypothetical protein
MPSVIESCLIENDSKRERERFKESDLIESELMRVI